jgi:AraC-like DNA-binding protein
MGTSYQTLIDESRRVRAEEWVRSTHMTIEQVSGRLGFSDVRSFRRAFKRWTGVTPHAFRGGPGDG